MKMKLCVIINDFNQGGAERLLIQSLPFFLKEGVEVEILQLSSKNSYSQFIEMIETYSIKCYTLSTKSLYNPMLILKIAKFLSEKKYDVVHVHLFPAMYWVSIAVKLMSKRPKLVFTEHSNQNKRLGNPMFKAIDRYIYAQYDSIIVISAAIKVKIDTWTNMSDRVSLIRNGVNFDKFDNAKAYGKEEFCAELLIPHNSILILMVARFAPPKDHITVLKALTLLPKNYFALFAGVGDELEKVIEYAKNLKIIDNVRFLGFRNDIPNLMKSSDINLLSSNYEGMSGVTLEALSVKKPFLGSDVEGINDVVPDNKYLFNLGDHINLAQKITNVYKNYMESNELIKNGYNHARKFNMDVMVKKYIEIYKDTLKH